MLALRFLQALPYRCCRRQYIFLNNRGPITWQAKNQSVVALFTLEAEYIACSDRTGEAIWLRCLLADIKKIGDSSKVSNSLNSPTPIWFENQGALRLIKNGVVKAKAKHIDVRYHHSHDEQKRGTVEFAYITSKKNVADLFYQISSSSNAPELIQMLGMIPENWPLYSCWTNYWYLCLSSKIEMSFMFYAYSTIVRICKYAIFWLGWILERGGCVVWHKTYSYVITPLLLSHYLTTYILLTFIHLSIRHDMQPGSPLEKQIKCLKGERTNNPEVVPYSPHEQVQNAKIECGTAIPKVKKQLPPPRWPSPVLSPPPRPRGGGGFLCHKGKPAWLRQISTSEVGNQGGCPASSELDADTSNWLNFRRLDFVPVSGGWYRMKRCFFSMSSIALGLGIHLQAWARERTHTLPHRGHLWSQRKRGGARCASAKSWGCRNHLSNRRDPAMELIMSVLAPPTCCEPFFVPSLHMGIELFDDHPSIKS